MSQLMMNLGVMGMRVQSEKLATIGNNIANSRTTAYKSNSISFAEEFAIRKGTTKSGVTRSFTNGVSVSGTNKDWTAGPIENTNVDSHLAVDGEGLLPVQFKGDTLFTRAGDFTIVEQGGAFVLTRPNGALLMGSATDTPVGTATTGLGIGVISFTNAPSTFTINSLTGEITSDDGGVITNGFVKVHRFTYPDALNDIEAGMYLPDEFTTGSVSDSNVRQGMLEASNVDIAKQFTDMIVAQRSFSANTRTIRTADEMMQEVLNLKR